MRIATDKMKPTFVTSANSPFTPSSGNKICLIKDWSGGCVAKLKGVRSNKDFTLNNDPYSTTGTAATFPPYFQTAYECSEVTVTSGTLLVWECGLDETYG